MKNLIVRTGDRYLRVLYKNAKIYDSHSQTFIEGDLLTDGALIAAAGNCPRYDMYDKTEQLDGKMLIPGLIDIHTHGRAGGDFISADNDMLVKMSKDYLRTGVTTLLPTLASAPLEDMYSASDRLADLVGKEETCNYAGVHIEGRYLNPKRRGAHAEKLLAPPNKDELERFVFRMRSRNGQVHITAALELDADGSFAKRAIELGATLGLGHTDATYEEAVKAIERGAVTFTHLFNAMPPLHHREGGAVCAGLADSEAFCEIIADGFHISPPMVRLAYLCKREKLVLITDSMEATGCGDGEYSIAGMPVTVKDGKARTHDGAIAGSTLDLFDAVQNLSAFAGIPFEKALFCATASPAMAVGLYDRTGSLERGKAADMLVLDKNKKILSVIKNGRKIF